MPNITIGNSENDGCPDTDIHLDSEGQFTKLSFINYFSFYNIYGLSKADLEKLGQFLIDYAKGL